MVNGRTSRQAIRTLLNILKAVSCKALEYLAENDNGVLTTTKARCLEILRPFVFICSRGLYSSELAMVVAGCYNEHEMCLHENIGEYSSLFEMVINELWRDANEDYDMITLKKMARLRVCETYAPLPLLRMMTAIIFHDPEFVFEIMDIEPYLASIEATVSFPVQEGHCFLPHRNVSSHFITSSFSDVRAEVVCVREHQVLTELITTSKIST